MSGRFRLLHKVSILALVLAFGSVSLIAQENQEKSTRGNKVTVTGCLQKGDEAGEYTITGTDGMQYGLRSKSVDLSKHVGHNVTVTGTKMREKNEAKEKDEKSEESAHLRVSSVKMNSTSCQ